MVWNTPRSAPLSPLASLPESDPADRVIVAVSIVIAEGTAGASVTPRMAAPREPQRDRQERQRGDQEKRTGRAAAIGSQYPAL